MGLPKTGRFGKLESPINDGVPFTNEPLAIVASKTIGPKTHTNRFFAHASRYWNKNPEFPYSWRLQGIVGQAEIIPGSVNDKISIKAAISYYKDNGSVAASAAPADVAVVRPGAGASAWYLVCLTLSSGAVTVEKGKDVTGARTLLLNTFDDPASGVAGSLPLIAATKIIVGGFKLDSSAAAAILSSDITYQDGNGRLLQERSDIPGGQENLLEGGVLFSADLLPCRTGNTTRIPYASFYSQQTAIEPVSDLIDWKFSSSQAAVSMPGKGSNPPRAELGGVPTTTGTASQYMIGRGCYDRFLKGGGYVKLYPDDRAAGEYYEAAVVWTSFDENNDSGAIKNGLAFTVDGFMERRGVS